MPMQASIPELAEQGYSGPVVVTEQGQDTPEGLILGAQVRPAGFAEPHSKCPSLPLQVSSCSQVRPTALQQPG